MGRRCNLRCFAALLGVLPIACTGSADPDAPPPATLSGTVVDVETGQPLPRVTVSAASEAAPGAQPISAGEAITSTSGAYRITGLDAEVRHRVVARTDGYDAAIQTITTAEGENRLDFTLGRSRVCTPASRRCTTPPAPAAILTCNAAGTGYDSAPCAGGEVCFVDRTLCAVEVELEVEIIESGGTGRVTSSPPGITCPPDCSETYAGGTRVTLTQTPLGGATFFRWGGPCSGNAGCELDLTADAKVTAHFQGTGPRITVQKMGLGRGTVVSTPPGIDCGGSCSAQFTEGERVTLAAIPANRGTFGGWTGCEPANLPRCQVTVMGPSSVRAQFVAFFERPLPAEMGCRLLLHLDRGSLAQGCGGGAPAVVTGTIAQVPSRNASLVDAIEARGPGDQGWIETQKLGITGRRSTVELTIHRLGDAFLGAGRGTLYSDRADPGAPGVTLAVSDDGTLRGTTRSAAGMETEVASMAGAIAVGSWYHVELLVDATRGLRLKIDDTLVGETTGAPAWTATASTAWIGAARAGDGAAEERFNGRIDEVRMGDYGRD